MSRAAPGRVLPCHVFVASWQHCWRALLPAVSLSFRPCVGSMPSHLPSWSPPPAPGVGPLHVWPSHVALRFPGLSPRRWSNRPTCIGPAPSPAPWPAAGFFHFLLWSEPPAPTSCPPAGPCVPTETSSAPASVLASPGDFLANDGLVSLQTPVPQTALPWACHVSVVLGPLPLPAGPL